MEDIQDVVDAIKDKMFNVYPVEHFEQALEVLTGLPAGDELADGSYEKDSLNDRVVKRLCQFAKLRKASLDDRQV